MNENKVYEKVIHDDVLSLVHSISALRMDGLFYCSNHNLSAGAIGEVHF